MLRSFALGLVLVGSLAAQLPVIPINGQVWDGNGGPFGPGVVYHVVSNGAACCLTVPAGRTLTIQPGAILKIDASITVQGTLFARQATFTSWLDDSVGGDSNGDGGTSSAARGDWAHLECSGDVVLEDCFFHYCGSANQGLHHRSGSMTMRRCEIRHCDADALRLDRNPGVVTDCTFRDCSGIAVESAELKFLPLLLDNLALDCDGGEFVRVVGGRIGAADGPVTIDPRNSVNGNQQFVLFSITNAIQVDQGARLTLPRGTVLKFEAGAVSVFGDLQVQGTAAAPVVFTSLEDDAYGGDTNEDGGASQPAPGDWRGIQVAGGGDATRLAHAVIRYGGSSGSSEAALKFSSNAAVASDCLIQFSPAHGVSFRGAWPTGFPRILRCRLEDNALSPCSDIPWESVAQSHGNSASRNARGDHFRVLPNRSTSSWTVGPENYPGPVLTVLARTILASGGELTLLAGTNLKFEDPRSSGFQVSLGGALRLTGTADEPIVMTSYRDDSVGGDTNGDGGATAPAPGDWSGLSLADDRVTSPSRVEHAVLRYAGERSVAVLDVASPLATLQAPRIEHCLGHGIDVATVAGDLANAVVWDAGGTGIRIRQRTAFDIVHATVFGCGGDGFGSTVSSWPGAIRNSISWSHGGAGFAAPLTAGNVFHSDGGFAGTNGNRAVAPAFRNASLGDFELGAASPLLGAAHLPTAIGTARDGKDASRVLDHALVGVALPDMGAYERASYWLTFTGTPVVGTTMRFTIRGPVGLSAAWLGFLDGTFFLPPFGVSLAGIQPLLFLSPTAVPVGSAIGMPIPNDPGLVGLEVGVQGLGVPATNPVAGAFTNVWRGAVR